VLLSLRVGRIWKCRSSIPSYLAYVSWDRLKPYRLISPFSKISWNFAVSLLGIIVDCFRVYRLLSVPSLVTSADQISIYGKGMCILSRYCWGPTLRYDQVLIRLWCQTDVVNYTLWSCDDLVFEQLSCQMLQRLSVSSAKMERSSTRKSLQSVRLVS
jgi:hypothetical protein